MCIYISIKAKSPKTRSFSKVVHNFISSVDAVVYIRHFVVDVEYLLQAWLDDLTLAVNRFKKEKLLQFNLSQFLKFVSECKFLSEANQNLNDFSEVKFATSIQNEQVSLICVIF